MAFFADLLSPPPTFVNVFPISLGKKCPVSLFQSMVSYLPGAGRRSLPESRERPFPKARRYGREKYMGARSGFGCRTNAGELFRAARTDVFRLSFRPMSGFGHAACRNGRKRTPGRNSPCPRFKRKTVKAFSPTLGIAGKSPQHSEDLQRKARPEGERPNNRPQKLLLNIP